ncbi:hypothetical protein T11_15538 [Trichinella zimbabwensis]|uniref:Uncharacterized protein n=1 Tax=Trichinella zimbabwensis TaxID=268475 RepID=A0A0V1HH72_9BILA|nr:hypothetical protein T11_15538 [Trichinella zimbabwensis]
MIKLCSPNGFLEMHVLRFLMMLVHKQHFQPKPSNNHLLKYTTITTYYKALNDEAKGADHIEA